jgi:hypothetical protein
MPRKRRIASLVYATWTSGRIGRHPEHGMTLNAPAGPIKAFLI